MRTKSTIVMDASVVYGQRACFLDRSRCPDDVGPKEIVAQRVDVKYWKEL